MISSVFGKTKPANYIILLAFLFLLYWYVQWVVFQLDYNTVSLFEQFIVSGILLFSVFLVNFIVRRNQINEVNSYAILFYALFFIIFPEVLVDNNAILCSFFILLAARRLISMRTLKDMPQKIFDASLWVMMASLFYEWAILYMIAVGITIYWYQPKSIKNWLIPLVAFLTITMIAGSWLIVTDRTSFLQEHFVFGVSAEFSSSMYWLGQMKLNIYLAIVIVATLIAYINLTRFGHGRIMSIRLITLFLGISIFITLIKTTEGYYPVVLTFFPVAAIFARHTEISKKKTLREILLMVSVAGAFLVFTLEWLIK